MPEDRTDRGSDFSDLYGRLLEEFAGQVGEGRTAYGEPSRNVREEIVRCVWFGGHFPTDGLTTDDGRRLEVISPGWWNVEGGPDFVGAELLLEGSGRLVGDVEVHTLAGGWYGHGHQRQPEYNDVALHVVMWNDREEDSVTSEDGRQVPQLTLSRAVEEDLEELVELVDMEGEAAGEERWSAVEGKYCGRALREGEIEAEWLGRLLDVAGDHRVMIRAEGIGELYRNHPRDQVLYERIAEALGYKNNRIPFMQLAGLVPIGKLRSAVPEEAPPEEKSTLIEAALFAAAGMLESVDLQAAERETAEYCRRLREAAEGPRTPEVQMTLSPEHWQFGGTRPVNYPGRRVAALARLCARHLHDGLYACFLRAVNTARPRPRQRFDTAVRGALLEQFLGLEHPYWSHRYTFGGTRVEKPRALVGRSRATSIIIDVLIPALLAQARNGEDRSLAERLHALWRGLPRRSGNAVTRRMEQVMFSDREAAREVVDSTRRQQGLHQLYRDCCRRDSGCERCVVYLARRAGKRLTPA